MGKYLLITNSGNDSLTMPMQWLDVENVKLPWIETARPTKEAIQCNVGRTNLFNQETAADVSCAEQI